LKKDIVNLKALNVKSKEIQTNWETKIQNNLDTSTFRIKELTAKKLLSDERIDTLQHENEQLQDVLDSKVTEIYQLKTRLSYLSSKVSESIKMKKKLDSLEEEIFIFEQNQTLLLESILNNQKLSSEILHRDKIIQALNKKLENSLERLRHINSIIHEKDKQIESFKLKIEKQFDEIQQQKQNIEYLSNVYEEKMNSLQKKYKTSKEINIYLEDRILQLNSKIESLTNQ
jgi:predicted RNase H-like nuclease (RuvC/YqgF family)